MKNKLLLSFTILISYTLTASAALYKNNNSTSSPLVVTDSLELFDISGNKINNGTLRILGSDPNVDVIDGYIRLKNNTKSNLQILVHKKINYAVRNTSNVFCIYPSCYGPMVFTSTQANTIHSGSVDTSFYCAYYPSGEGGMSSFTFEFYDSISHPKPVYAKATIEFAISATGINENNLTNYRIFPNPSDRVANLEFDLPVGHRKAQLVIRNTLGVIVENTELTDRSGRKAIDVSNYASGFYFYSLVVDGKILLSKKMVVKH